MGDIAKQASLAVEHPVQPLSHHIEIPGQFCHLVLALTADTDIEVPLGHTLCGGP